MVKGLLTLFFLGIGPLFRGLESDFSGGNHCEHKLIYRGTWGKGSRRGPGGGSISLGHPLDSIVILLN